MALPSIDRQEYLKRYLSAESDDSKKKKRRKKEKTGIKAISGYTIVDDDVDMRAIAASSSKQDELSNPLIEDETPLIADIIDERPEEEIILQGYRTSQKWKTMGDSDPSRRRSGGDVRHDSSSELDVAPRRSGAIDQGMRSGRLRHDSPSGSDLSPPRRSPKGSRPRHHSSDSDLSPPRNAATSDKRGSHGRPVGRPRHDSDSDLSPVRKSERNVSPLRRRSASDSDQSPIRRQNQDAIAREANDHRRRPAVANSNRHSGSDLSPPRTTNNSRDHHRLKDRRGERRHNSDLSPPRRKSSTSPVKSRRRRQDSDLSPPRRRSKRMPSMERNSSRTNDGRDDPRTRGPPTDRYGGGDSDLSPKRHSPPSPRNHRDGRTKKQQEKTLAGAKAGLSDSRTMRRENEECRHRDNDLYAKMDDAVSGRNAKTVFRDKSGRTRDLESEKRQKKEDEVKKSKDDEQFMAWGKGVVQGANQARSLQDAMHEMDKPMARYRDDEDLDAMLKEQERDGDPMMAFMKKKKQKKRQDMGIPEKPKYTGPLAPPNRYNIQPGYRWDGVDRSSGFERKAFARQADKKAMKEVAYKWSIEDM